MKKYIWGMGYYFEYIERVFPEIFDDEELYFIDANKYKKNTGTKHVIYPDLLYEEKDDVVVYICATDDKIIDDIGKSASKYSCIKELRHIDELISPVIDRIRKDFKPFVLNKLGDSISEDIFEAKWTGFERHDPFAIYDVIFQLDRINGSIPIHEGNRFPAEQDIISTLVNRTDEKLVLVGITDESARMVKVACVIPDAFLRRDDRSPEDFGLDIPEISFEDAIDKYKDAYFISGCAFDQEIQKKLIKAGVYYGKFKMRHSCWRQQYFDEPFLSPDHGVFIDAGALDLNTSLDYMRWNYYAFERIYAFEPDHGNCARCNKTLEKLDECIADKIQLINAGCYERDDILRFDEKHNGCSNLSDTGNVSVTVRSIDSVLEGGKATYIKMDIEGSELYALKGAAKTISKWHPMLAICIYHKVDDIYTLTKYILSLVPDYRIYIRHYSTCTAETVMYFI